MKHISFRPALELKHHKESASKGFLELKSQGETLSSLDISENLLEKNKNQEKLPIGIETSMIYVAIPISIAMWIGIIYLLNLVFF